MEASALRQPNAQSATLLKDPRAGFLRLQSDERLVALTRRGNEAAFETLIARYRVRLLAFSRHMVGSTEDAEDILQEVFVSAYRAMLADDRELNVRPWLYRIARNRSLNHLRRPRPTGVDSMDIFEGGAAVATADRVHDKLDLEDLMQDVKKLPETQRTALMLREMGDLSYDQIAEAMDTSIPSVKSLLVRARVSLAEASESRRLSCDEVRMELGAVSEGLQKLTSPARRHVTDCERCRNFKKELATTNRKLTMLAPVGVFAAFKAIAALKIFGGAATGGSSAIGGGAAAGAGSAAAGGTAAGVGAAAAATGAASGGGAAAGAAAGISAVAAKVGTGLVAAALVTGGVAQVAKHDISRAKVDQRPVAAAIAPTSHDSAATGGAVAGVAPVAAAELKSDAGATDPTAPVTTTPVVATTPETSSPTTGSTGKPVVEKETTTVNLNDKPSSGNGGPTTSNETPGMPTAPPAQSTPAPSPPATTTPPAPPVVVTPETPHAGDGSTGSEGSTSDAGPTG
jgi:RNA polymerase sigma factor (sigma-70 family)